MFWNGALTVNVYAHLPMFMMTNGSSVAPVWGHSFDDSRIESCC